jgi:hypothetical protein
MQKSKEIQGEYLGASEKYEFFFWRYIIIFDTTFILNTLTKDQWI